MSMACALSSSSWLLLVLGLCCVYVSAQGFIFPGDYSNDRCTTPDNQRGKCISIFNCDPISDYIAKIQNRVNDEIRKRIQPYMCGRENDYPKVCCPSGPIPIPDDSVSDKNPNSNGNQMSLTDKLKLLPSNDCGVTPNIERIVGGVNASLFEFPWMAALMYKSSRGPEFQCGGSLINNRYILTAAHCLRPANKRLQKELVQVRLGEHDFSTEEDCEITRNRTGHLISKVCAPAVQNFEVSMDDVIIHPNYNEVTLADDIALIRLRRNADLTAVSVNPICLPAQEVTKRTTFKKNLTVCGWGTTENGTSSDYLLKVVVPSVDNKKCSTLYKGPIIVTDKQMCAGGRNSQNTCAGDSGGPLMQQVSVNLVLRTVQYGVVSAGPTLCEKKDFPVRYTRVMAYMDWILENIRP